MARKLICQLFPADVEDINPSVNLLYDEDDDINLFEESPPRELSKAEKLDELLNDAMEDTDISAIQFHHPANASDQLVNFSQTKVCSPLLKNLFDALKTMPSSSIESEGAFSITGQFVTKLRTSLGDDSIDALVYKKATKKR